jgi:HK97 family phage portal protein
MRIRYLWRIPPDRVRIWYDLEAKNPEDAITYMVRGADGYETPYLRDEILHVSGLGYDGICGYSPIRLQMLALGWNKAAVKYGANFFKNSSRPSFLAFAKGVVKKEAKADIIKNLTMAGRKAGEGLLIEGDMDIKQLTMPQDEAQFIETMQYQEEDIAGIMEVKPHEIGIMRHMTNNNVEQETISSVTRCLAPFAVNVEQWFNLQLLSDTRSSGLGGGTERDRYFMECELKGLLRGDTAAQTAHIEKMIDRGVYSQNDACDYLGVPGFSGGERHYINSAYIPLEKIDEFLMRRFSTAGSTSTNNNQPSGDQQPPDQRNKILTPIFRDAVGRVIARKKDREKATVSIFRNLMAAVGHKGEEFLTEYLNAMGQRSLDWSDIDAVASAELARAIHAFSEAQ